MSIDLDVADGIATITFNRPERLNALDPEHYSTLSKTFVTVRDEAPTASTAAAPALPM